MCSCQQRDKTVKELLGGAVLDRLLFDMDSLFNRCKHVELLQQDPDCRQTCRRGKMGRDVRDRLVHSDGSPPEISKVDVFTRMDLRHSFCKPPLGLFVTSLGKN